MENTTINKLENLNIDKEDSDNEDEFLNKLYDEDDAFNAFNPSVEPDMERRLSEKPAMGREGSYEY